MRVKLTFHDGNVTCAEAPQGVEVMLDEMASKVGYDLRPCLACPPQIIEEDTPLPILAVEPPTAIDLKPEPEQPTED